MAPPWYIPMFLCRWEVLHCLQANLAFHPQVLHEANVAPQEGILVAIRTPVPCPRSFAGSPNVVSRSLLRSSAICFRQSHATPCHRRRKARREIIESSRHFSLRLCDNELTSPSLQRPRKKNADFVKQQPSRARQSS